MSDQKQMWQLVKFELSGLSWKYFLILLLVFGVTAFMFEVFISLIYQDGREDFSDIVFDCLLLFVVFFYPQVLRQPSFRMASLKGGLYATPFYVYATQLPIKQHVLMSSRFVLSLLHHVGVVVIAIILAYVYPGSIRALFSLWEFIAFLVIWGLLAAAFAGTFAAADVGATYTKKALFGYNILYLLVLISVLAGLNLLTGHGLVGWTIELGRNAPFLGIAGFTLFTLLCNGIWHLEARRYARKVDYHV